MVAWSAFESAADEREGRGWRGGKEASSGAPFQGQQPRGEGEVSASMSTSGMSERRTGRSRRVGSLDPRRASVGQPVSRCSEVLTTSFVEGDSWRRAVSGQSRNGGGAADVCGAARRDHGVVDGRLDPCRSTLTAPTIPRRDARGREGRRDQPESKGAVGSEPSAGAKVLDRHLGSSAQNSQI
jgi:hypothetical protein